jgi:O-antigen ligase
MKVSFKNVILAILVCFLAYSFLPEEQKQRFESMGDDGTSTSRLLYWEKGFEMLKEHPILGIGYYSFPQYFADYYSHERHESGVTIHRQEVSHNSFVEVASTMGYVGLGVYLSLILYCFQQNKKTRRFSKLENNSSGQWPIALAYGFDASLLTYIVGSLFMSVAFYPYIYLSIMLSYSLANCVGKES